MSLIPATDLDTSPVEWLAENVLPRTGIGIIWGASTAGKSLVAMDLALSVANGQPWLGVPVTHTGSVAYALGEGVADAGIRLKARQAREQADQTAAIAEIARTRGDQAARDAVEALPPYDASRLYVMTEAFVMHFDRADKPSPSMRQAVSQLAALPDLELVCVDALADFCGQLSLANDSSASRLVKGMKYLARELDCFVLAVAHPTADGSKLFGAARWFNAMDTVLEVTPDEVSAPGAMSSATISVRKNKSSDLAEPWGYFIQPCQWQQEGEDPENGEPTGEMVTIKSATVRRIEQDKPSAQAPEPQRQAPPLPVLQPVEKRTKRNGIRKDRGQLHVVPDVPAPPSVVPAPPTVADARHEFARALLTPKCEACSRPPGMGCDQKMLPAPLPLIRTAAGQAYVHRSRIDENAIMATALEQSDPEAFLDYAIRALATLTGTAARSAPVPPPPAKTKPGQDDRLWWTTVRPDSKLAQA